MFLTNYKSFQPLANKTCFIIQENKLHFIFESFVFRPICQGKQCQDTAGIIFCISWVWNKEWDHKKYQRGEQEQPEVVDNRRQRTLEAYGGGEIFDQLDEEVADSGGAAGGDMFDWVIRETLNTLDENAHQRAEDIVTGHVHA